MTCLVPTITLRVTGEGAAGRPAPTGDHWVQLHLSLGLALVEMSERDMATANKYHTAAKGALQAAQGRDGTPLSQGPLRIAGAVLYLMPWFLRMESSAYPLDPVVPPPSATI